MPDRRRASRVAERIREEAATLLIAGTGDPRVVGLVTVTGVEVTPDLRRATVFVSVLGTDEEKTATFAGLAGMAGQLRMRLARTLGLRLAPEVEFRHDRSIEHAARIETLLSQLRDDADDGPERRD